MALPRLRSIHLWALLAVTLVVTGCLDESGSDTDQGPPGPPPERCLCDTAAQTRCAGRQVEACQNGSWAPQQLCAEDEVCAGGQCYLPGTGCPDTAIPSGGQVVLERRAPQIAVQKESCVQAGGADSAVTWDAEDFSEIHRRLVQFADLRGCSSTNAKSAVNYSQIFGIDTTAQVDSSSAFPLQGLIPAGQGAKTVFRQAYKVGRFAVLLREGNYVGTATLVDWKYEFETAPEASCTATSKAQSSLPAASTSSPSCFASHEGCQSCP